MKTFKRAFTLIEMLVVISIIVLLLSLLGAGLMRYYSSAVGIANVQFLQTVENTIGNFQGDFGHYPYYSESTWVNGDRDKVMSVNARLYADLSGGGGSEANTDVNYFDGVLSAQSPHLQVTSTIHDTYGNPLIYLFDRKPTRRRVTQTTGDGGGGRGSAGTVGGTVTYVTETSGRPSGAPGFIGGMRSYFELWSMGPSGEFWNLTHSSVDRVAPNRTEDDDNEIATNIGSGERFTE